ncbi:MAG: nucleotidyltransferase family protein [Candidatus Eremiobacterota bacterium]
MDALITAGSNWRDPVARHAGVAWRSLAPVGGRPLLRRVVDAVLDCPGVRRLVIVGGPPQMRGLADLWLPDAGGGAANFLAGLSAMGEAAQCLFCSSDLPFLEPQALARFVADSDPEAVVNYSITDRASFEREFPGARRRFVPLREGAYTGGGVLLLRPHGALSIQVTIRRVFEARKNTLRIARMLGLPFLAGRLLGTLTIGSLEERASAVTGVACRAVPSDPRLAFDLDHPEDYAWAAAFVASG